MGFFDNLGSKINDVSNQVSSKLKDSGEQLRLSNEISQLNKQVAQKYQQLGEMVYKAYKNKPDEAPDCRSVYAEIDELQKGIDERNSESTPSRRRSSARSVEKRFRQMPPSVLSAVQRSPSRNRNRQSLMNR